MGRLYVASVLMSISGRRPSKDEVAELKPIAPGAWAAWARRWEEEQHEGQPTDSSSEPEAVPTPLSPAATRA